MPTQSWKQALPELKQVLDEGRLAVVAGSGVSVASGLPTWDQMFDSFLQFCRDLPADAKSPAFRDILSAAPARFKKQPLMTATVLRNALREVNSTQYNVDDAFQSWLTNLIAGKKPNRNHQLLVATDFPLLITTNYDDLLKLAAQSAGYRQLAFRTYSYTHAASLALVVHGRKSAIVHAHGRHSSMKIADIVFTADDYAKLMSRYPGFSIVMRSVFTQYSMLFVGYGMSDPHLESLSEELTEAFSFSTDAQLPHGYILVQEAKVDAVVSSFKQSRRMKLITYSTHAEVTKFLNALRLHRPRPAETP